MDTQGRSFHSPELASRISELEGRLAASLETQISTLTLSPSSRTRWISTSKGSSAAFVSGDSVSSYFANSLASPVHFAQAVEALPHKSKVYEVGPSNGLLKLVSQTRSDLDCVSLVKRNQPKTEAIFR